MKIAYINFLNHCYVDTEVEMKEIYTSNHMWKLFENFLVDICRVSKPLFSSMATITSLRLSGFYNNTKIQWAIFLCFGVFRCATIQVTASMLTPFWSATWQRQSWASSQRFSAHPFLTRAPACRYLTATTLSNVVWLTVQGSCKHTVYSSFKCDQLMWHQPVSI